MAACGPSLKRLVLELGGKDPMVVCGDADLEVAADFAVRESMRNTGQVCCSVERIYVEQDAGETLHRAGGGEDQARSPSGPAPRTCSWGRWRTAPSATRSSSQLEDAVSKGARILCGGKAIDGVGFFMQPTVITNVDESMQILTEETFGPVATIRVVSDADEAVRLANDSPFGLGASVWCGDNERGVALASRIESGQVGVNRGLGGAGDPPWCGVKQSGFGFLGSPDGYRQFTPAPLRLLERRRVSGDEDPGAARARRPRRPAAAGRPTAAAGALVRGGSAASSAPPAASAATTTATASVTCTPPGPIAGPSPVGWACR